MFREPMMAAALDTFPEQLDPARWITELKLDGWRAVAGVHRTGAWLESRAGRRIESVPYINEFLHEHLPRNTILDGEIVDLAAPVERSWNRAQSILSRHRQHQPSLEDPALTYVVFDVLAVGGVDTMGLTLAERKQVLGELGLCVGDLVVGRGAWEPALPDAYDRALAAGYEGVVLKDLESTYRQGARGPGWLKLKATHTEDVTVVNLPHDGEGKYAGMVGALEFAFPDGTIGRCSGMTDAERRDMTEHPENWVGLMVEVRHMGVTADGRWRHPQYIRRRDDRTPDLMSALAQPKPKRQARRPPAPPPAAARPWKRNYVAMGDEKLLGCINELEHQYGDAYDRCAARGGDPAVHLADATRAAAARGLL